MIISSRLEQAALETLAADPVTAVVTGRVYWNSVSKTVRIWDGTVWTDLVGADGTTLKDIDGGAALDTRRLTIPKAAKAALVALTRKQGTIVFASDENLMYYDNGAALVAFGTSLSGQSQWDEINGGVGPKSFYSNVNYATAAAATYNDVVILGNLTLNHDWVALGDVFVSGQIISNGFKLTVDGDLTALGGGAVTGSAVSWTVRGEFFSGADWVCTNSGATQPTFTVGKEFTAYDVAADLLKAVTMNGLASGAGAGRPGYLLKVGGNFSGGAVDLSGSAAFAGSGAVGGAGGALVVKDDLVASSVTTAGGAADNTGVGAAGGAAGGLTAGRIIVSGSVTLAGGAGAGTAGPGGNGGAFVCGGDGRVGGTSLSVVAGAGAAATAAVAANGTVAVEGSLYAPAALINTGVGGTTVCTTARLDGGAISVKGSLFCSRIFANGSATNGFTKGGAGGAVTIGGDLVQGVVGVTAFSNGGGGNTATGSSKSGGDVGVVLIGGNWICRGAVQIVGGNTPNNAAVVTGVTGGGGRVVGSAPMVTVLGNVDWSDPAGTLQDHAIIGGNVNTIGNDSSTNFPGNSPGLAVFGHCVIRGTLNVGAGVQRGSSRVGEALPGPVHLFGGGVISSLVIDVTLNSGSILPRGAGVDLAFVFSGVCSFGRFDILTSGANTWLSGNWGGIRSGLSGAATPVPGLVMVAVGVDTTTIYAAVASGIIPALNVLPLAHLATGCHCVGRPNGTNTEWRSNEKSEGTFTANFTMNGTGGGTDSRVFDLVRHGDLVTVVATTSGAAATGTASTIYSCAAGTVPVAFRPLSNMSCFARIREGGVNLGAIGLIEFRSDGSIRIYKDATGGVTAWTNAQANSGDVLNHSYCYSIRN